MCLVCTYQLHRIRIGNCGVAVLRYFEYGSSTVLRNIAILSTKPHTGCCSVNVLDLYSYSSVQISGQSFSPSVPSGQCRDKYIHEAMTDDRNSFHVFIYQLPYHEHDVVLTNRQSWNVNHWHAHTYTQHHVFEGRNFNVPCKGTGGPHSGMKAGGMYGVQW